MADMIVPTSSVRTPTKRSAPDAETVVNSTTPQTSSKKRKTLYDTPSKAERYVKKYVGISDDSTLKDPQKFNLRPGVWQRWTSDEIVGLVRYIQENINLVPFARHLDKPVEEVQEVLHQTVCADLYTIADISKERLYRRMKAQIKLRLKKGEPERQRTKELIDGEFYKVKAGMIVLVTKDESETLLTPEQLSEEDLKYLKDQLRDDQWRLLHVHMAEKEKSKRVEVAAQDNGEDLRMQEVVGA